MYGRGIREEGSEGRIGKGEMLKSYLRNKITVLFAENANNKMHMITSQRKWNK